MLMATLFNAEGIATKIFTDANACILALYPIPDRSLCYLSTTLLLMGSAIYNGAQACVVTSAIVLA